MQWILLLMACMLLASPAIAQSVGEKTGVNSTLGIAPKAMDEVWDGDVIKAFGNTLAGQSSAMLASPRRPSRTMRIFSSAEWRLRATRRMFFTSRSDGDLGVHGFLSHLLDGYDEPEILPSSSR